MLGLDHKKRLIGLINQAARRHGAYDVFRDFCEMGAIAISNSVDLWQKPAREERYLQLIGQYEPDVQQLFPQMLGELVACLEAGPDDVLGRVFMELELSSKWSGQFFTPMCLAECMAKMTITDLESLLQQQPFVTVNEPAVGGGAMIFGLCKAMTAAGYNYQQVMHVTAVDIDIRCIHMCYLQCSLLYVPAVIIHGNSLSLEERSHWYTPAHVFGNWTWKLRRQQEGPSASLPCLERPVEDAEDIVATVMTLEPPAMKADLQLALF
jgi:hypothetical protein